VNDPFLVRVLDGFTLDVPEGETMVIIGYSGTGKSVAIKHIVGLLEPDEGEVWVDGVNVPELSRRELYALRARIGYVFQFAALFDSYTIGENVSMGLRKQGELSEHEIALRVEEALDLVDLPGVQERFPAELSGGMRKRVGIARALSVEPEMLLFDEPTAGLDPTNSKLVADLMLDLRGGVCDTAMVVTHDVDEAIVLADRVIVMRPRPGRLQEEIVTDLPRPRDRQSAAFDFAKRRVMTALDRSLDRRASVDDGQTLTDEGAARWW
jgi:ABC-type transporter Mla maintaining outer membrane lipid asymmetry ATPase subunit MlaF